MSVMRFSVSNIAKLATAGKLDTNMRAEAEQHSYDIFKNWMTLSLNVLISNIFVKNEYTNSPSHSALLLSGLFGTELE